jgi:hypothetical protein
MLKTLVRKSEMNRLLQTQALMGEYKNGSYRKRACEYGLDSSGSGGWGNHEYWNNFLEHILLGYNTV